MYFMANFKCNLTPSAIASYFHTFNSLSFPKSFFANHQIIFFPPQIALEQASALSKFAHIGAQNAYPAQSGAFTGEIGLQMLESMGINIIMIGHSERRTLLKESQEFIAQKTRYFLDSGFKVVYCIGESLEIRNSGMEAIKKHLSAQFSGIDSSAQNLIVAYEPIWAIGTGASASINDIESTHAFLRTLTSAPLLYGGSVNENNVREILRINNVNGALVGSASLNPHTFYAITQAL